MDLSTAKQKLHDLDPELDRYPVAVFETFETPQGSLCVMVTERLRRKCRKGRVWKSKNMLTALKNAAYGYDPRASHSRGGVDGIFAIDRSFKPVNSMMRKLFARFLDRPDPLVKIVAELFASPPEEWVPARLVSHHMRLLGILVSANKETCLILVDFDDEKHG